MNYQTANDIAVRFALDVLNRSGHYPSRRTRFCKELRNQPKGQVLRHGKMKHPLPADHAVVEENVEVFVGLTKNR
jgi:hypothetical protein